MTGTSPGRVPMGIAMFIAVMAVVHGALELAQSPAEITSHRFTAIGGNPQWCQPWHCMPAESVMPTFALAGIATIAMGVALGVWAIVFRMRGAHPAATLALFAIGLVLSGGGNFGPLVGLITSIVLAIRGRRVRVPQAAKS